MRYTCGCFDSEGSVLTADNVTLPLSQVKVGDTIQAVDTKGNVVFSDVYYARVSNLDGDGVQTVRCSAGVTLVLCLCCLTL